MHFFAHIEGELDIYSATQLPKVPRGGVLGEGQSSDQNLDAWTPRRISLLY